MSHIQITDAGVALMAASESPIVLTSYKLGSAYGYIPTAGQTALQGSVVATGVPGAPVIQTSNTVLYPTLLGQSDGPYTFGEIGYYYGSTLFAVLVLDTLVTKTPLDVNTNAGGAIVIDAFVPMVGSNYQMWANVSQSNINKVSVAAGPEALPYSVNSNPNVFIVQAYGSAKPFLAYTDRLGLWTFDAYDKSNDVVTVGNSVTAVTITLSDYGSLNFTTVGSLLLQFQDGINAAAVRYVTAATPDGHGNMVLTLNAPLTRASNNGDRLGIYVPTTTVINEGGGGGQDLTNLPHIPSLPSTSAQMPVVINGTVYQWNLGELTTWLSQQGFNRPPTGTDYTVGTLDSAGQLTGNLYSTISDPDADPLTLQTIGYTNDGGAFTTYDPTQGSVQLTLGVFFVDPTSGNWTFTLGQGARALNTGDIGHEIITYVMADGKGGIRTNHLTITVTGTNQAPIVSFVNSGTPTNTTVSGNLIYRLAFDYETTPSIAGYTVAGMTGTFTGTTTITVGSTTYGQISIASDGTWSFAPAQDYVGPVPTVTYNVTDGVNVVPSYLTLAVTPMISGSQPQILGTDVVAGPTTGGENNQGMYLTIYGRRFGPNSGIGTNTKVFIGGVEVVHYIQMVDDQLAPKFSGLQRIDVRVGALGSPVQGEALHIKVTYGGQDSNQDFTFTPNPGRFLYVSHAGNDTTAVVGDITHPFRMLQYPTRTQRSVYTELLAGDTVIIMDSDGQPWTDIGYNSTWFRFRDPQQQGKAPTGQAGTGWMTFKGYPGQYIHYITTGNDLAGGLQGPGSAFTGTCGDWVAVSNLNMEVQGGSRRDAGPINMQYNSERWRITGCNLGPWVAGSSAVLNAACITGEGNFIYIAFNKMHDIEGTSALQNHGIYAGTTSYGWEICFNWITNCIGGSHIQFNDSDGGTNIFQTPYGVWTGFTNIKIHHNWLDTSAKYGILFADINTGNGGQLDFLVWNNIILNTGLAPLRLNTNTTTSSGLYAFNTCYNCVQVDQAGTGNGFLRNEGNQSAPGHVIRAYNNIFACGPQTTTNAMHWFVASSDSTGSDGYDLKRNVYWAAGRTIPNDSTETMGIYGDPLFTNVSTADFSLQASSPALNAGTYPLGSLLNVVDDFTAMNTRLYGGAPDCGALERAVSTPFNITAPAFSGGPQVGVSTSGGLGTWGNSPTSYRTDWTVNDVIKASFFNSSGTSSYTPVAADVRYVLKEVVTATNGSGSSQFTRVIGTIAMGVGGPVNTSLPTISGTAQVGNVLTCNPGTWSGSITGGFLYQWYRVVSGVATALGSPTSSTTYTCTNGDYQNTLLCEVQAVNTTTGNGIVRSGQTATVIAGVANPTLVSGQVATAVPTSNTNNTISMPNPVSSGNAIVCVAQSWDNAPDNGRITDTQGNVYAGFGSGSTGTYTMYARAPVPDSNNPNSQFFAVRLTADQTTYTTTYNPAAIASGALIFVEITGVDVTTLVDVPQSSATSSSHGTAIALVGSTPNTKATDLELVQVTVEGTGVTFSGLPAGWVQVGIISSAFSTLALFANKASTIETLNFSCTASASVGWTAQSLIIKGA